MTLNAEATGHNLSLFKNQRSVLLRFIINNNKTVNDDLDLAYSKILNEDNVDRRAGPSRPPLYTHRNIFEISLNQTQIRLYLPFSE